MTDNELVLTSDESGLAAALDPSVITPDYFLVHYPEFLRM